VLDRADPVWLLSQVDAVWTITSTLGFEALLRGVPVTTLGAPFYAGWGLTRDLGPVPARRLAHRPTLAALVHAVLIAYPRYYDPVSRLPCPPEVVLERLAGGPLPQPPCAAGSGQAARGTGGIRTFMALTPARPCVKSGA
jgi:capsular polysaccharide export protein